MLVTSLKKQINNANAQYNAGTMTAEEYAQFKETTLNKLDVFLTCDRIKPKQYEELNSMFIEVTEE